MAKDAWVKHFSLSWDTTNGNFSQKVGGACDDSSLQIIATTSLLYDAQKLRREGSHATQIEAGPSPVLGVWITLCLPSRSDGRGDGTRRNSFSTLNASTHTCMHTNTRIPIHAHIHTHTCTLTYIHTYTHGYTTLTHTDTRTLSYLYTHIRQRLHILTHTHTRTVTYLYTHIHQRLHTLTHKHTRTVTHI